MRADLAWGAGYRDNVPRRQAFEAENPDLEIIYNQDEGRWHARGHLASRPGDVYVNDRDLGELLDRLGAP
jgi:hypothetical protein